MPYYFRKLNARDLDFVREVRFDPDVQKQLHHQLPYNHSKQKKWIKTLEEDPTKNYGIISSGEPDGEYYMKDCTDIALVRMDCIDTQNKSVRVGLDIHKDYRGKGHARGLYKFLFDWCFIKMGMNRVWLEVIETNTIAHELYKKVGFVEEGRMRQSIIREGIKIDSIIMSILKEEYLLRETN